MKATIGKGLLLAGAVLVWLAVPQPTLAGGACTCARFNDWKDLGCRMAPGLVGGPGSEASQAGGNQANCPDCPPRDGIARWHVSEPYENLIITDEPLSYRMSTGQRMVFRWHYKQRYELPRADECPNLYNVAGYNWITRLQEDRYYLGYERCYGMTNGGWGHNWMMDVTFWDQPWEVTKGLWNGQHQNYPVPVFSQEYEALVFRPEGGIYYFYSTNSASVLTDPLGQVSLQARSGLGYPTMSTGASQDGNGIVWDELGAGFRLVYPDGSQDVFGLAVYGLAYTFGSQQPDSTAHAFLTQRIDPQGRAILVGYERVGFQSVVIYRPKYIVDVDGRTNMLSYNDSGLSPFMVSQITSPYSQVAQFTWGGNGFTNGLLLSITDAATNTSSFAYSGTSGWITNLSTPYGATAFTHYEAPDSSVTRGFSQRAMYVQEPEGARQLFYYLHYTNVLAATATPPSGPGQTFDDGTAGGLHCALSYRNTFRWDRRQFSALSAGAMNLFNNPAYLSYYGLGGVLGYLSGADFAKAELKHWRLGSDGVSITESLSSQREPSVDAGGQVEGARTWYNYATNRYNYASPEVEGGAQITCVARLLPDGTSQYGLYNYFTNSAAPWGGLVASSRRSFSEANGAVGELTNWFSYATNGIDLLSVSNSLGQYVNFGYNTDHQVTFITNALGQVDRFVYDDPTRHLANVSTASGLTATLSYYPSNGLSANGGYVSNIVWVPTGRSLTFTWTNGLPWVVQAAGTGLPDLWLTNSWDGLNRRTLTAFPDGTTVSNIYDKLDLGATKDRLGYWTSFGHDAFQHLTWITDALTNTTQYGWCDCGSLSTITDATGTNVTVFNRNNQGVLTNKLFADGSSLTWAVDSLGRPMRVADGQGRALSAGYNNQGLMTVVSNAYTALERVVYDVGDRPVQVTDENGVTHTNEFDLIGQLLKRSWPAGMAGGASGVEGFLWATNGLLAYTNQDGWVTGCWRDEAGRLLGVTNANLEVTRFAYNALDEHTDIWDGLNQHTGFGYNEFGWLLSKTNALGREVLRLSRDANGQVTNRWTPQFGNTGYVLDPVGNLKRINYPQSTVSYAYDVLNRLSTMVDAVGTTTFGHTPTGNLQSETGPWATLSYGYTEGLRTSMAVGSLGFGYGYDGAWRLYSLTSPAGTFGYTFDAQRPMLATLLTLPNQASIASHFDSLARLDSTALANKWGLVLDGYGYTHDVLGLRTNITRNLGLTTSSVSVGYDQIAQIISWSAKEANGTPRLNEQLGLGFDKAGNLLSRTNGGLIQAFHCDALNELTNITRNSVMTVSGNTPAPATSVTVNGQPAQTNGDFTFAATNISLSNGQNVFTSVAANAYGARVTNILALSLPASVMLRYDSNGNLTNDGSRSFAYDAENQLTNVTVTNAAAATSCKAEFVYDGLGRRRITKEFAWQGGQWVKTNETRGVFDGWLLVQERDTNNNVLRTYTRGPDLSGGLSGAGGIGGLLARTDGNGASMFYHSDGAGNITALMDGAQNVAARYMQDPFGRLIGKWGPMADVNEMLFSSMPMHQLSGLSLYPFRAYDSGLQRWLSRDPIGERGGINLYGFVGNNPISRIDPLGRDFISSGNYDLNDAFQDMGGNEDQEAVKTHFVNEFLDPFIKTTFQEWGKFVATGIASEFAGEALGAFLRPFAKFLKPLKAKPCPPKPMVTVLGSGRDVAPYVDKPGFNTFTGGGIAQAELDTQNALWLNTAIQKGDQIWLVTDPAAHANFLSTLPGNPQSAYLNLELPMLSEYSGVNAIPKYVSAPAAAVP